VVKSRDALMDAAYDDRSMSTTNDRQPHQALRRKFKAVDTSFDVIETL
jgi:DNA-binding winged helix-turn-helix (wHTH) protein